MPGLADSRWAQAEPQADEPLAQKSRSQAPAKEVEPLQTRRNDAVLRGVDRTPPSSTGAVGMPLKGARKQHTTPSSSSRIVQGGDIIIHENGDVCITTLSQASNGVVTVTDFITASESVSKSKYLKNELLKSGEPDSITLEDIDKDAFHVYLVHVHGLATEVVSRGLLEVSISSVWHLVELLERFESGKEKTLFCKWFVEWHKHFTTTQELGVEDARTLALPCAYFDYAQGFAAVTRYLVYNNYGHIKEKRPDDFRKKLNLHLAPADFVGPTNHARGGLKSHLHKALWSKVAALLKFHDPPCSCWDRTSGQYLRELVRIHVFPVEEVVPHIAMTEVLARLDDFNLDYQPDCTRCDVDWPHLIKKARSSTEKHFDGLCLDCMDRSKPKRGDTSQDYWMHNESINGCWDSRCRIRHGQATWYVSWLGRDDIRQKLLRKKHGDESDDEDQE